MELTPQEKKPAPKRWKRWAAIVILLIACVVVFYFIHDVKNDDKSHSRPQAPIAITPASRKDIPVYLNGLGTVQAYNTVTVHSQIDGQLNQVLFREGQNVKAGFVLARIDPRTYQAQLDQAIATKAKDEAQLANAKLDLQRYISLGNTVSGQTVDTQHATVLQYDATVKADQANIDNARTLLSYTVIQSPIDGRTGIRQVDQGNIIHSADTNGLVVVTQLQPISVIFSLPQQDLQEINRQIQTQGALSLIAVGADNKTLIDSGTLELVDNEIDQTTGTIKLKATFPNQDYMLWPGGFTNVRLLLTTQEQALVVPTVAIQIGPQNVNYVFVYKPESGTVEQRTIKIAMAEGDDSVIDSGLQEGEQIVTDGMSKLQDGSKVSLAKPDADNATTVTPTTADKNPADDSAKEKKHRHKDSKDTKG